LAIDEIRQCIELQKDVNWHSEIVPAHVLRADSIGLVDDSVDLGYVLLAVTYNDSKESVIGFARVTSTMDLNKHWLHEIVTSSKFQSKGIGFGIMQAIRAKSLELGGKELYFTYDPFEGQNGRLYLTKCGAKVVRIHENLYGQAKSGAHANRKTHRCLVRWDLRQLSPSSRKIKDIEAIPAISDISILDMEPRIRVEIPYKVQALSTQEAMAWQERTMPILVEAINVKGYHATYLHTLPSKRCNFLLLEK